MKKNGFTLVELLAVIVLLAILMAIAVPNALKLNSKVNNKAYDTKIELIEQAADSYGLSNLSFVKKGVNPKTSRNAICEITFEGDDIKTIKYNDRGTAEFYDPNLTLTQTGENRDYWCIQLNVADLVKSGDLDWDEKNQCQGRCSAENHEDYDNIVINPVTKYVINRCFVYIYYRNNRVYSYFDKKSCDTKTESPINSYQYRQFEE